MHNVGYRSFCLSHTSFQVTRISSLLAQIEQVKLVSIKLQGNSHFFEWKNDGIVGLFLTDGDIVNLFALLRLLRCSRFLDFHINTQSISI